jgi:SRSO17 transposase
MLPQQSLPMPASWRDLLEVCRPAFKRASTFALFTLVVSGMVLSVRRRTVAGMLAASGLARVVSFHRCCRFFSHAVWNADALGLTVARHIVDRLLPAGAPVEVVVDETLFKRWGRRVFKAL